MKSKIVIAFVLLAMASSVALASGVGALRLDLTLSPSFQSPLASLSDPSHINGTVTNAVTMSPIKDANVTANPINTTLASFSTLTDEKGQYNLEVAPVNYTVTVAKSGFISQSKNATVMTNQTTTIDFALSPIPAQIGWITGNVTDASTHMPIGNAAITAANETTETNTTGLYKIQLAPGTYNVTASKNGYMNQTKTGIVKADNVTTIDFALVKIAPPLSNQTEATIEVNPRALNLRSQGRWVTVSIELPKNFSAKNVDVSSIRLNNTIPVNMKAPMEITNSILTVKFSRETVEALILKELGQDGKFGTVTLTITGKLKDGMTFTGSDRIKTILNMPN